MRGTMWWITGLSGAGKSTVGRIVRDELVARGRPALLLDGDVLRAALGETGRHTADDRWRLAMTYARLGREITAQGIDAVCATISMFHAVREWNRANVSSYREIYLRVPLSELERRDTRGLYARSRRGEETDVVGIDMRFEEPIAPHLVIDNVGIAPAQAAARILSMEER
jgi:adenylylsulfate kinase